MEDTATTAEILMANTERAGVGSPPRRARSVVTLDANLLADARAAVRFLRGRDQPECALGDVVDQRSADGPERSRREDNAGAACATSGEPLPEAQHRSRRAAGRWMPHGCRSTLVRPWTT